MKVSRVLKRADIRIKDFMDAEFELWERVLYFAILPLGFIASGVLGYLFGTL